ncbi:MAG: hypothetical protein WAM30_05185 [Candidatus Dormiibacterota bacterium]
MVLMNITAGRGRDTADLERMLGAAAESDWERARHLVERWRHQDLNDLESLRQMGPWERLGRDYTEDQGPSRDQGPSW